MVPTKRVGAAGSKTYTAATLAGVERAGAALAASAAGGLDADSRRARDDVAGLASNQDLDDFLTGHELRLAIDLADLEGGLLRDHGGDGAESEEKDGGELHFGRWQRASKSGFWLSRWRMKSGCGCAGAESGLMRGERKAGRGRGLRGFYRPRE
jgi:hypothetical protein